MSQPRLWPGTPSSAYGGAAISGASAVRGTRKIWVSTLSAFAEVPVYERDALSIGQVVAGPAVIQEASSTLVLPAGAHAKVDASGSVTVDLEVAAAG